MINIAFSSDDNYAPLLGVTISSLLKNNKEKIRIFILDGGISKAKKNKILSIPKTDRVSIYFVSIKPIEKKFEGKLKSTRVFSAFSRLFLPSLLDENIDKIIYLDCDALVSGSLKKLWDCNIKDYYCAAVLDAGPNYIKSFIDLPVTSDYFNSGFLYINLKKWRENSLEEKFIKYIEDNNFNVFHNDQGIINYVCRNNILKIHPKYNILSPFFEVGYDKIMDFYGIKNYYNKELVQEAMNKPVFIHLTQFVYGRPWFDNMKTHPLRSLFDSYAKETPFNKDEIYRKDDRHLEGKILSLTYRIFPFSFVCFLFKVYRSFFVKKEKGI